MNSHSADGPLKRLKEELESTLRRVQHDLESYLEDPDEVAALRGVADGIEHIHGVLVMLERSEAAQLTDEVGALTRGLIREEVGEPTIAREILLRAILQISLYLQRLEHKGHGQGLDFQSLINQLRAARGEVSLPGEGIGGEAAAACKLRAEELSRLAAELRPQLQRALLGVVRRQNVLDNLERMAALFGQFKKAVRTEAAYRFWWLAQGLVLELRNGGIELGRTTTLILRDLDHQIKRLITATAISFTETSEQELIQRIINQLSTSSGGLARLENPSDYHPPQCDAAMQDLLPEQIPPDTETLRQIAALLQEPLALAKDGVDRFARGEERRAIVLQGELESLHQVANVLILLNMDAAAELIRLQLDLLRQLAAADREISDTQLLQLASGLILVEDSLEGIIEFVYNQKLAVTTAGEEAVHLLNHLASQRVRTGIIEEIVSNLGQARELVGVHLNNTDNPTVWTDLPPILHSVTGALALLEYQQPVGLMTRLEAVIRVWIAGELSIEDTVFMSAFAEIMVALEYYLQRLGDGRGADDDILDHAEQPLRSLEGLMGAPLSLGSEPLVPEITASTVPVIAAPQVDQEFVEVFFEEARGELANLREHLAAWRNDLTNTSALAAMRRAFHTLKGSGRMVGQTTIGETSWCLENLLNHVLDGRLAALPWIVEAVDDAQAMLGRMVGDGPVDNGEAEALAELVARIEVLLQGGASIEAKAELQFQPEDLVEEPAVPFTEMSAVEISESTKAAAEQRLQTDLAAPTHLDRELVQVFLQEASEILDASGVILQRWAVDLADVELLNDFRREMHTLKGSSRMAGLMAVADLAHAMESLLDAMAMGKVMVSTTVITTLQRALDYLHDMLMRVHRGTEIVTAEDLIGECNDLWHSGTELKTSEAVPHPAMVGKAIPTELDQELIQAFLEEAAEILDTSDTTLQRWSTDLANVELLNDFRREMHTLKGSSRMAGFMLIGDLAHAVESVLDAMAMGTMMASITVITLLQRTLDRLHAMVMRGREGSGIAVAEDLIDELKGLLASAEPAAPQHDVRPEEMAVAPMGVDTVRVDARLLDTLINQIGESTIYRARVEQGVDALRFNLTEMEQIVARLCQQLRRLEIETEAQILFRYETRSNDYQEDFDPLELDRFSELQQLSRSLMEVVDDLSNIYNGLEDHVHEIDFLVDQQAKVNREIQQGLMQTGMVRFDSIIPRLRRVVRQVCQELDKQADLVVEGLESELERTVLEHIVAPLEHVLRNAVAHGIEMPAERCAIGKPEIGTITLALHREGSEWVLRLSDDGAGLDFEAIRAKGERSGLLLPGQSVSEQDLVALLLRPGFSTAGHITQVSGRGVGLDVLSGAIKKMRGTLQVQSRRGQGVDFIIRLPFSLALTQALLIQAAGETYAIPILGVKTVTRLKDGEFQAYLKGETVEHEYGGHRYPVHSLGALLGGALSHGSVVDLRPPVLLFHSAEASAALQADRVLGSQEIIVKPVGPQLLAVPGISGATVLGDGCVVVVLEVAALVRNLASKAQRQVEVRALNLARQGVQQTPLSVLVIDDSITMRKVTARVLERHKISVAVAKDGVDAIALLQGRVPDLIILDIEMPRMDGYELVTHIRNQPHLKHLPVIMVTSRSGEKHRERAAKLGVNDYLGKPYQEEELIRAIRKVLGERGLEVQAR